MKKITQEEAFDFGRKYQDIARSKSFHIFLGYGGIFFGLVLYLFSVHIIRISIIGISIEIIGFISLYLGYSQEKELEEIEKKIKGEKK